LALVYYVLNMKTPQADKSRSGVHRRTAFALPAALVFAVLLLPAQALAFGGGGDGCGAGTCSECHSFEQAEAEKLLSGLVDKIHSVDFAVVPGLWKVDVEAKGKRGSLYIDFSKSYAISGRVLRLADWADVTSTQAAQTPEKVDFSEIPLRNAPVMGSREAPKKVAVFTDPQCPFCGKLHAELKKILSGRGDIAFYMKLFPLSSHPDSYRISTSIICDGSLTYLEKSFNDEPVPDPSCKTDEIDNNLALVKKLGIRSTPTLVLPDGTILPGFKPAEKLLEILDGGP
jgi:thiol:disulfide interchange protein DsbC